MELPWSIKFTQIEPFKELTKYIASLTTDERLPLTIRLEIMDRLEKIMEDK